MSKNIAQVFSTNPITVNSATDLMYFGQAPYSVTDDAAMTFANFSAQFGVPFTPAALTETNDTNVILTLGGTPATALLQAVSITAGWAGTLSLSRGGSGNALTATAGGVTYSTASAMAFTAAGTTGQLLTSAGTSAPTWTTATYPATTTINQLLYSSSSNTVTGLTTLDNGVLITSSTGVPELLANSGTEGFVLTANTGAPPSWQAGSSVTPAALTEGSDTNIVLTLGGTPATALLQAASITASWSGTLGLDRGGLAADLTASNGGIFYSTSTAGAILSGTATANLPLLSGSTAAPIWGPHALVLAGSFTTSGAFSVTQTYTASTSVTFPTSGTLATTSQLPTPAALTETNDTNVTLTLGGTPSTALLQATSITAGWSGTLSLARGGLAAAITASNGGIFYSNASTGALLSGTTTARQMLQSGASTTPAWSTTTWPSTTTINQILYSSSSSVIGGITTGDSGVLVTSSSGVPSIIAAGTTGQMLQASSAGTPAWSTTTYPATNAINTILYASAANVMSALATANNGVLITGTTGTPSILANSATAGFVLTANSSAPPSWQAASSGGGISWVAASSTPITAAVNTGYYITDSSQVTITLPATAAAGSIVAIVGNGSGGWILKPGSSQTIKVIGSSASTSITSAEQYDTIEVLCTVANTTWVARSLLSTGLTIV